MQDLLTLATTATLFGSIGYVIISYAAYVWHRTAPAVVVPVEPEAPASLPALFAAVDTIMSSPLYDEPPAPEVLEVPAVAVDEQVTHQAAPNYATMSIVELKAIGKQYNVPGWKTWKKPQTAIARLEALAA